ncbi:unnamed protein product [Caenorhabditis bovis]|uniref:Major facilitator superfamily (MFS) profile domain-containing protein n=1 Tax=Caenorhabditis bovis TaxID=2654633 RepID=A0A8S1EBE2_9PELO|nr:unnamed protein product [Caenorhabditis bovis]
MISKKVLVFIVTFTSYGLYHANRKALSGVKSSIKADWLSNSTHRPLFNNEADAKHFLGSLDAIFMAAYAVALFFWGWLGDRLNPKIVVAAGMFGSSIFLTLFGTLPKWLNFYSTFYYVIIYICFGLVQACGWPSEIAIMANWFGKGNRGFVMGVWAACQPVGNIFGSMFTAFVLPLGYEYTFLLNSVLIFIGAIVVLTAIDEKPHTSHYENIETQSLQSEEPNDTPIGLIKALFLPGVLAYCVCNACLKLVNYAFFFWLPLYLTDAYHWEEYQADQLSIWYDFGGIIGSVIGGYITDKMGKRSPLIVAMLVCSIGSLYLYAHVGPYMFWNALVMTTVGVTVSGPYNLIVGSISIDLGSQPALAGNTQAMSTVSGLLDGTGSAGSAIGQIFIPVIQDTLGWRAVFYVFMILNGLAVLSILKRCFIDLKSLQRIRNGEESPLLEDGEHED